MPGCKAAHEDLTGRGSPERKREDGRTFRPNQLDLVVVSNDGALRHRRLLNMHMGVRVNFTRRNR